MERVEMIDLGRALFLLPGLVIAISVHEFAHAFSASLLGDDLARRHGRVSLNPFRHLSPLGTLAIFLLPFGWGRPVPVNLYNFKHPKRDYLLTSLAGPFANILVVGVCIALMQLTRHSYRYDQTGRMLMDLAHYLLMSIALINTILAVVNLIPIPPLDGSKIWYCLIPRLKPSFGRKTMWLFMVILVVLLWTNSLGSLIDVALGSVMRIVPASDAQLYEDRYDAGRAAYEEKRYGVAEQLFTRALGVNPRAHECLYLRACARGWQGNWVSALEDMTDAIELDDSNPTYYEYRADVYEGLGKDEQAANDRALSQIIRAARRNAQANPS